MAGYVILLTRLSIDEVVNQQGHKDGRVCDTIDKVKHRQGSKSSGSLRWPGM